jgi:precorrin-4 methylase
VVLVDALVNRGCLAHARPDARIVEVGKRAGAGTSQAFIEKLCIQHAKAGQTVARLKGGDPFVFGRGGEELRALLDAGIDAGCGAGRAGREGACPQRGRCLATHLTVNEGLADESRAGGGATERGGEQRGYGAGTTAPEESYPTP